MSIAKRMLQQQLLQIRIIVETIRPKEKKMELDKIYNNDCMKLIVNERGGLLI